MLVKPKVGTSVSQDRGKKLVKGVKQEVEVYKREVSTVQERYTKEVLHKSSTRGRGKYCAREVRWPTRAAREGEERGMPPQQKVFSWACWCWWALGRVAKKRGTGIGDFKGVGGAQRTGRRRSFVST